MGAQMVAMSIIVGPVTQTLTIERIDENAFSVCEGGRILYICAFGVLVMGLVLVYAAVQGIPVSLAGICQSAQKDE